MRDAYLREQLSQEPGGSGLDSLPFNSSDPKQTLKSLWTFLFQGLYRPCWSFFIQTSLDSRTLYAHFFIYEFGSILFKIKFKWNSELEFFSSGVNKPFLKGVQIVSILGYVGHTSLLGLEVTVDADINEQGCVSINFCLWTPGFEYHVIFFFSCH